MTYDTYICYSQKLYWYASDLVKFLESKKLKCFFIPRNLYPAIPIEKSIEIGLYASKSVIFIYSGEGDTLEIPQELLLAKEMNIPILPIKENEITNTNLFNDIIPQENWIAMPEPIDMEFFKLVGTTLITYIKNSSYKPVDNHIPVKNNLVLNPVADNIITPKLKIGLISFTLIVLISMILFIVNLISSEHSYDPADYYMEINISPETYGGFYKENLSKYIFFSRNIDTTKKEFFTTISSNSDKKFTLIATNDQPFNSETVSINISRFNPSTNYFDVLFSDKFEINPNWNLFFIKDILFPSNGLYRFLISNSNGENVSSGLFYINGINSDLEDDNYPLLYFCESYSDKPVNTSDRFTTGTISVIFESTNPINTDEAVILIEEIDIINDNVLSKNTYNFKLNPEWNYLHFDEINFDKPGFYRVSLIDKRNKVLASNFIEIVEN